MKRNLDLIRNNANVNIENSEKSTAFTYSIKNKSVGDGSLGIHKQDNCLEVR